MLLSGVKNQAEVLPRSAASSAYSSRSARQTRARIQESLAELHIDLSHAAELLEAAVDFLAAPGDLYARASDKDRQLLNQVVFSKLYVYDETRVTYEPCDMLEDLLALGERHQQAKPVRSRQAGTDVRRTASGRSGPQREAAPLARRPKEDAGSNRAAMVEMLRAYANHPGELERLVTVVRRVESGGEGPRETVVVPARARRLDRDEIAELVERYRAGETAGTLGEAFGVDRRTVAAILKRQGVVLRWRKIEPEEHGAIVRLYQAGESSASIAERHGVHARTIQVILKQQDVRSRPVGTNQFYRGQGQQA